jgi:DnaJ-class molecular chaperone
MATFPRQRLISNLDNDACRNCAGRGFLLISHTSPDGYVEPNEVNECSICDGTGKKRNPNQAE